MKQVIIGSKNPVKAAVVKNAFSQAFPTETFTFVTHPVESGVADQPFGWQETRQGAHNRAATCAIEYPDADFTVGLEGGIEILNEEYWVTAWMCIRNTEGRLGFGRTGSFLLPAAVVRLIKDGKELGRATDEVFGSVDSGYKNGVIGFLTNDTIDRARYYENAMVYALIPFIRTELF